MKEIFTKEGLTITKSLVNGLYTYHRFRVPMVTFTQQFMLAIAQAVLKEELPLCDTYTSNSKFDYRVMISKYPDSCLDCPFANLDDDRLDMGDIFCRITEEIHPNNELHPMRQRPDDCPLQIL